MGREEFLDMVAIAESTPGPIAVNSATYLGYKLGGVLGAMVATLGVVLPSFTIIFVISLFFDAFLSVQYVGYAFKGVQVCVVYLILSAGWKLLKQMDKNPLNVCITFSVLAAMIACSVFAVNFSSIYFILLSGGVGLLVWLIHTARGKGSGTA